MKKKMAKPAKGDLGDGTRFGALVSELRDKGKSVGQAKGLAASIGAKKYGKKKMSAMAAKGKKRKGKKKAK